jgi:hypothetical protein
MIRDSLPEDLQSHEATLYQIARDGLALFLSRFGTVRAGMTIRSERSNINDCVVEVAKRHFPHRLSQNLFLICVGPYRLKPKKLNSRLETANIRTQMVLDFEHQQDLFDDGPTINLLLGYVPDELDLMASSIWISCPGGADSTWAYELSGEPSTSEASIPRATSLEAATKEPRVTPRRRELPKTGSGHKDG